MDTELILNIAATVILIVVGFAASYMKTRGDLLSMATTLISQAEEEYRDSTKAGGKKFTWVCEKLYNGIPKWLYPFISYQEVEKLVQATFDEIESYANRQLNNFVDKVADEMYNSAAD